LSSGWFETVVKIILTRWCYSGVCSSVWQTRLWSD